ncbi:TetR/AcrR family transcriptional regulator [Methanobacterium formicicum]|uniref:TetR family transcriptional regulator n=1 Tax=Methanobacterium formicicum (strain DSM 3637 / PP1) TaxID=1204725 RepID=K2R2D0_METFP|nr:TetR/AcrR family transcriptional regulator [Methanobacterium formicicum]EKF86688.1 TetR family transcriptional regulator [Methanobacterium formicicum DSM 3637]
MAIQDRREREKEQRRKDIFKAAEKLFLSRGYDDVSMNDIASAVELSKATLYLYFDNKEELFFAIVRRGNLILNSMIKKAVENAQTGIDKVSAFRMAHHEFNRDYPDYIRIYNYFQSGRFDIADNYDITEINNSIDLKYSCIPGGTYTRTMYNLEDFSMKNASEYLKDILKMRSERFSIMCNSVTTGINDGTIRPDVDPAEAAILLSSISKSMSDIPQDHEKILENKGINHDKFIVDVEKMIRHMIKNKDK